jgi:MFS family permease
MPYFSLYALELGATKEMLGVLSTIQAFSVMLGQLPGGVLADKLGRKRTIIVFGVFEVLTPLSYFLARSWPHLILGTVSQSVGWACEPAISAIVVESIPKNVRGTGLGIYQFITWLPRMFMQFVGGVILDTTGLTPGFRAILAWSTIASTLILVIRARGLHETLVHAEPEDLSREDVEESSPLKLPKSIWAMIAVGGLSSFAVRMTMDFLVVYAVEVIGLTKAGWGLITMITGVLSSSLNTFGGILSDKIGRKPCILTSRLIEPLTTLGLTATRSFTKSCSYRF